MHCLKLSPNLRKNTKEYRAALLSEDDKTSEKMTCEVKQLTSILDMVKDPDVDAEEIFCKEEDEEFL